MSAAVAPSALLEKPATTDGKPDPRWQPVMPLPCELTVDLAIPGFKVADFLSLRAGSVVGTRWGIPRDVPLRVNGTLIAWGELEAPGKHLAVRLTELA